MATENKANYLFWIGGIAVAVSAVRTVLTGAITLASGLVLLVGVFTLVWGLLKTGREDIARWTIIVIAAMAMAARWVIKR